MINNTFCVSSASYLRTITSVLCLICAAPSEGNRHDKIFRTEFANGISEMRPLRQLYTSTKIKCLVLRRAEHLQSPELAC